MITNRFRITFFISAALATFLKASPVSAICPVCTVAVGAGVGLSRYLGIDDTITGIWIGALTASMIGWTISWLNGRNIKFYGRKILITVSFYAIVVGPLFWKGIIGHPFNKMWGMDKLLLGIILGSIFFTAGAIAHFQLKKRNGDKVYFPFQKVVFAVAPLVFLSIIFYFITV